MKFTATAAAITTLLAATGASASGYCGSSTFVNKSSGGSPLVSDCQELARQYSSVAKAIEVGTDRGIEVHRYGTCVFGVIQRSPSGFYIGDDDVKDIIRDSIAVFQLNGRVGTEGDMSCTAYSTTGNRPADGYAPVWWGIYHA